jgi:hypothetical protein
MQKCTGISNCRAYASDWLGDFIPRGKIVFTKLLACFLVWSKHPGTMTRLSITEQPPRRPVLSTFGAKSWLNERLPVEIYTGRRRKPWHLFGFGWIANECNSSQSGPDLSSRSRGSILPQERQMGHCSIYAVWLHRPCPLFDHRLHGSQFHRFNNLRFAIDKLSTPIYRTCFTQSMGNAIPSPLGSLPALYTCCPSS